MRKPVLVLVSGPPCSGKSHLARRIASAFGLPCLAKDDIKETLFDSLGSDDVGWSRKLSAASISVLFRLAGVLLEAGQDILLEANFRRDLAPQDLRRIMPVGGVDIVQVYLWAEPDELIRRFRARWENGERHPGHQDNLLLDQTERSIRDDTYRALDIDGVTVTVDTTDLELIDEVPAFEAVRTALDRRRSCAEQPG